MWIPKDLYALPTPQETADGRKAIEQLKAQVQVANEQCSRIEKEKGTLEKEIQERETWLAPVRRLKQDELGAIFEFCGEDDWKTPLRIMLVCKVWNNAVLATPRAWAFLDLKSLEAQRHLPRFLERSGKILLHAAIDDSTQAWVAQTLGKASDRLGCLTIPSLGPEMQVAQFPHLKSLYVFNDNWMTATRLTQSAFPQLRFLCLSVSDRTLFRASDYGFKPPPLEDLTLSTSTGPLAVVLLQMWSQTLTNLTVFLRGVTQLRDVTLIHLPFLQTLDWTDKRLGNVRSTGLVKVVAPNLINFSTSMEQIASLCIVEDNAVQIRRIRGINTQPLSSFPQLKTLHLISRRQHLNDILAMIQSSLAWLQSLTMVEYTVPPRQPWVPGDIEERIASISLLRGQELAFMVSKKWEHAIPGAEKWNCGPNMPCGY